MFPNPQDALPLPPRPSLKQYKKLAKDLVKACKTGNPDRLHQWASKWVRNLVRLSESQKTQDLPIEDRRWIDEVSEFSRQRLFSEDGKCALANAQFVIARSHGFVSWPVMVKHIEQLTLRNSSVAQFEEAADAIVLGNIETLTRLLRDNPDLVRNRSTREHRATLLHYASANGVEGYRQKTPKNIAQITELLIGSGADVDAEADVYGGGCTVLGLAATSVHPEKAGVQDELLQVLLDHGASLGKPKIAGSTHSLVIACLANGRLRAGEFLATRGAQLDLESAAGLGRMDIVKAFFHPDGGLKPPATKGQLQNGFLWACMYGQEDVAVFLLDHGAEPANPADSGATGLHWAAGGGHLKLVKLLLDRGASLEQPNMWGGTVLEHAGWGFEHSDTITDFVPVFEALLSAGAKIHGSWLTWINKVKRRSSEEKERLAQVLRRYGAST